MRRLVILLALFTSTYIYSQTYDVANSPYLSVGDALTQSQLMGSARYVATGGVMGSVGGDISTLSTNPAGLAMFSRTELQYTNNLEINDVSSNFIYFTDPKAQSGSKLNRVKYVVGNLGAVFANRRGEEKSLRASNITVAINRTADYNRSIPINANNGVYSYSQYLAASLNSVYQQDNSALTSTNTLYNFPREEMGYLTGLLYVNNTNNQVQSYLTRPVEQYGVKAISGGIEELSVAWSGSIKDKFYVGVSLGIPFFKYQSDFSFSEDALSNPVVSHPDYGKLLSYTINEQDKFTGTGVNVKFGGLAKIGERFKVSGYFHSPTYIEIANNYQISMTSEFQKTTNARTETFDEYKFSYTTPMKFGGGLSYLFGKRGFIGSEVEYDLVKMNSISFTEANSVNFANQMNSFFKSNRSNTITVRVGGEFVIKQFRLRAGYNYTSSPYIKSIVVEKGDMINQTITFGGGYRGNSFSIDAAYSRSMFRGYNSFYNDPRGTEFGISSWNNKNNIVLTFNYRFNDN